MSIIPDSVSSDTSPPGSPQDEADKRLDQRLEQLAYWKSELDGKLAEVKQKIDSMDVTLLRVMKAESDLQEPLQRAKDCLEMRYGKYNYQV